MAENNKLVQQEIFEAGLVDICPRTCNCPNCQIAKQQPTNLEKLLDKVYSPVKKDILPTPESSPETEQKIGSKDIPSSPLPSSVHHLGLGEEDSPLAAPLEKVNPHCPVFYYASYISQIRTENPLKELDITPASPVSVIFQMIVPKEIQAFQKYITTLGLQPESSYGRVLCEHS